jgi:hypothetical protein
VTNKGFALYVFAPDAARDVTCTGSWYVMRPLGQIIGN